jgi:hypothetical protein
MKPFIVVSVLHRVLVRLREHPRWTWLGLLVYATIVTVPHENVQDFVVAIGKSIGRAHLYQIAGGIGIAGLLILSILMFQRLRTQPARTVPAIFWLLTMGLCVATWRLLTANNTELVHYPQYIPEGMALLAITLSPVESLCWVAIFGGIDEAFQYYGLHGGWGIPYDFNDIYMDLLGGALGVLIGANLLRCLPAPHEPAFIRKLLARPGVIAICGIVALSLILLLTGRMLLYKDDANPNYWIALSRSKPGAFWFFDDTWGPHVFHTLLPLEGPTVILGTIALFAIFERRIAISPKP